MSAFNSPCEINCGSSFVLWRDACHSILVSMTSGVSVTEQLRVGKELRQNSTQVYSTTLGLQFFYFEAITSR